MPPAAIPDQGGRLEGAWLAGWPLGAATSDVRGEECTEDQACAQAAKVSKRTNARLEREEDIDQQEEEPLTDYSVGGRS